MRKAAFQIDDNRKTRKMPSSQSTRMEVIHASPVPTKFTSNVSHHRVFRAGPSVLILRPAKIPSMLWTGICLAPLSPIIYCVLPHFYPDRQLLTWGSLAPLFASIPLIVFSLVSGVIGIRARFDRDAGTLVLAGMGFGAGAEYPLSQVREVQLCSSGIKQAGGKYPFEAFQLNLLIDQAGENKTINLLENADEIALRDMGCSISEFLEIPFNDAAKANFLFRRQARKIGALLSRRMAAVFLYILAGFCAVLAGVLWCDTDVDRRATLTTGALALCMSVFTTAWAFFWRLSSFKCVACGGKLKTAKDVNGTTLLVCQQCGQSAATGIYSRSR